MSAIDEDWQRLVVQTRPPTGGGINTRTFERASWSTRGNFACVRIDDKAELAELWIPLSLLVEIRVLRPS